MKNNPKAAIVIIGNEILSGRTADCNTQFLAGELAKIGIAIAQVRIIPDVEPEIIRHINELRKDYNYVFTTGGIGPTHDDITALAISKAFSVELKFNQEALSILKDYYPPERLNDARLKMAMIPVGASLIPNPISKAPGFIIDNVYVMAGVPNIMQAMFGEIKNQLQGGVPIESRSVVIALPEGNIADKLTSLQNGYPEIDIGSYPFVNERKQWCTNIVLRGTDLNQLNEAFLELSSWSNSA